MPSKHFRFVLSAIATMCFATVAFAQMPAYKQAGPVPPALTAAKTVFVSNAGSDSDLFPLPFERVHLYSGDPDRAYTEFFQALQKAGNFTLVADPAQADLVLELHLIAPYQPISSDIHAPTPMFRLVVYDRKTHYILWAITNSIETCARQSTCDKNFDTALDGVLNQFLQITGKAPAPAH